MPPTGAVLRVRLTAAARTKRNRLKGARRAVQLRSDRPDLLGIEPRLNHRRQLLSVPLLGAGAAKR